MAAIQKDLLSIGQISLRLGVPYAALKRFFWRPRPYVSTICRARGVAEEDLPRMLEDLKSEGFLKPPAKEDEL